MVINLQRWTGAFHMPLVLQVFSVYFNITSRGCTVEGLKYELSDGEQPRAALALAAAAMTTFPHFMM